MLDKVLLFVDSYGLSTFVMCTYLLDRWELASKLKRISGRTIDTISLEDLHDYILLSIDTFHCSNVTLFYYLDRKKIASIKIVTIEAKNCALFVPYLCQKRIKNSKKYQIPQSMILIGTYLSFI